MGYLTQCPNFKEVVCFYIYYGVVVNMDEKVKVSLGIIKRALDNYPEVAVACSYGKDSIVLVDL